MKYKYKYETINTEVIEEDEWIGSRGEEGWKLVTVIKEDSWKTYYWMKEEQK